MDDDRIDTDLLDQHDIRREGMLKRIIPHRGAAVLDDEGLAGKTMHVGKRFGQRPSGFQIVGRFL